MEDARVYPRVFLFQYGLYYLTYAICIFLHCKGYFLEWHSDIAHLDPSKCDGDHDIDCKIDGIGAMKLKSEFVKKV